MANAATAKYVIRLEDKTKRAFKAIGRSLKSVTKSIFSMKAGLISAAGIAGLGFLVKRSMNATDEMAKMSRAIGVSVEELSQLRHAASLGGLEATQLDKAVQKLAINMADMSRGVGLAKDVFEKHNISVKNADGSLRTVMAVMSDVADVTAGMTNETEKADLAYKLFGARGAKMINMLNGGSEAMKAAMEEAKLLGLVMSAETAKGVEDANDSFTRLQAFMTSTFAQTVAALAPAIKSMTDALIEFITLKVRNTDGGIAAIATSMANSIIDATIHILLALENTANGVIAFVTKMKVALGFGNEIETLKDDLEGLQQVRDNFINGVIMGEDDMADRFKGYAIKIKEALGIFTDDDTTANIIADLDAEIATMTATLDELTKAGNTATMSLDFSGIIHGLETSKQMIVLMDDAVGATVEKMEVLDEVTTKAADPQKWSAITTGFMAYQSTVKTGTDFIASTTSKLFQGVEDSIMAMISGAKFSWKSLFKGIMLDLARIQVKKAILGVATSIFGFAAGGRPPVGRPSIVGERGAELFVPDSAGTIIPNHELGGSTKNTSAEINFNVQAIDAASFNTFLVNNRDTIESIINNSLLTNGSVRRTIQMVG